MVEAAVAGGASLIGLYLQIQGMRESGKMARIRGEMERVGYEFQAWEAERRAGTSIAISQRQSAEERRQANLVASRALAVSAASGAGVSDPTMVRVIANARGEGAVRAANALYEGQARARALRTDAALGRLSGSEADVTGQAIEGSYATAAKGAVLKESFGLYAKYGMNGPSSGRGDAALVSEMVPGQFSTSNPAYG